MTAAEFIQETIKPKYARHAKVVVQPAKGLGAVYALKPADQLPEDNLDQTIFIRLEQIA